MTFRPRSCVAPLPLRALVFCFCVTSSHCFADLTTFEYSAIVEDSVTDGFPDAAPFDAFNGELINLSFTFDSVLVDSNGSANGDYSPITSAQVMLGSNTYTNTNFGTISIINNGVNPDQYIVNGPVTGPSIIHGGVTYDEMFLNLILTDTTQSVFSTDALPTIQPNPSDFTSAQLRLDFTDSTDINNFGLVGTNTVAAVPEPKSLVNVTYDSPVIDFGPLSFGLTELPAAPEVTFSLGDGTPAGGGATNYGLSDVLSANVIFGDAIGMNLTSFAMEVDAGGTTTALSYAFALSDTPTVLGLIALNFPFSVTGTDIASGQAFSYTYANSEVTITPVPEPTTFALCALLGLVGVASRHRRR